VALPFDDLKREQGRQLEHWRLASRRLADFHSVAPTASWQALEYYLGVSLRQTLTETTSRLQRWGDELATRLNAVRAPDELRQLAGQILEFRRRYLKAETTVDFYADALATRADPRMGALLRACDHIATRSMAEGLAPLRRQVPAALTYLDAGLGASILKAGLRLWDGTAESPVATIKVVRHNLLRPTAVIHEAGHQVAFMLGWVDQLAARLRSGLGSIGPARIAEMFASWSSEIAADAYAFVHTGYAAVAALRDVVDGGRHKVFEYLPQDPHQPAHLRVLNGIEMCRSTYGAGAWDTLDAVWRAQYPLDRAPADSAGVLDACVALLPQATEIILRTPYPAFDGKPLVALVNPQRVSPAALADLERAVGPTAVKSPYLLWNESIRLLALTGYRAARGALPLREATAQQEQWMLKLGALRSAA
jgi:hypothetical protein